MNIAAKTEKRPVGRPRSDGKAHLDRVTLLKSTAKLIAANGYSGTSIRKIASALDISTASIFNLYPSKEALLNALIAFVAAPSFKFYAQLNGQSHPAAVALYKSIFEETKAVASVDHDYVAVFYLPELLKPEFSEAQAVRARMVAHYSALIDEGIETGVFRAVDPHWAAEQVFQLTETSILAGKPGDRSALLATATETAEFCLRGLLLAQEQLAEIKTLSDQIELRIDIDG